ncbi:hypothetical protein BJV82DRAFT_513575 [Fennellomyces sp. T-0311]|nr:hypothetical protein BJV82DRAFT_513575 [Fennellomyces sp. T-0311]
MLWYFAFAGIVFRFEAGILLTIIVVLELAHRTLPFKTLVVHGLLGVCTSLALTVSVDSHFWQQWLWPEGVVFYFNAILNKSGEWGTMPFYAYFGSFLPRLLLISYPLAWIAFVTDHRVRRMLIPSLIYIGLFSAMPHKEWRFIIYTIPVFTAAASVLASRLSGYKLLIAVAGAMASLACALMMLWISMHNYPGGHALRALHNQASSVSVHMDVPTAMTGASRFGQVLHPQWSYHKNESHDSPDDYIEAEYTHLITSQPAYHRKEFQLVGQTFGLESVKLKSPSEYIRHATLRDWLPFHIITAPKLYTLKLMNPQKTWIQHTLRKHRVVLYSKTYCPYCRRAKQILDRYCDDYFVVEVDQRQDGPQMKQALMELSGRRTFPNLFVDGQSLGGSDDLVHLERLGKLSEILPCVP